MARGPEDPTLQDRGQRKPEEHPELRLAHSLPEGEATFSSIAKPHLKGQHVRFRGI